NEGPL
ncbi:hypothetical protein TrRE_jg1960, partial [Triparma retinervis]